MDRMRDFWIRRAVLADIEALAPLFDAYRQFYALPADPVLAQDYLCDRLRSGESVVFVAGDEAAHPFGFVQLYPTYCSLAAARVFVLYDLWVQPEARRRGVARGLMEAAAAHALGAGAARLDLMTGTDNVAAQRLYEALGWIRDDRFYTYSLRLPGRPPPSG